MHFYCNRRKQPYLAAGRILRMSLKEKISADIKDAMKQHQREKVDVLRMLSARILEREVELRTSKGRDYSLSDEEALQVISTYAKQRRQSIESYRKGSRVDLAEKEERELEIVNSYLPRQLTDRELERLVNEVICETGASNPSHLGVVMKEIMPRVQGQADGRRVNEVVRRKLSG